MLPSAGVCRAGAAGSATTSFGPACAADASVSAAKTARAPLRAITSEHHGRVNPGVDIAGPADLEAMPRIVDWLAVIGVRNTAGYVFGRAAVGSFGAVARPGLAQVIGKVGVAGLVEGDEVRLRQRVAGANVELHELTNLPVYAAGQRVDTVLLHVGQAREIHTLRVGIDHRRAA